MMMIRLLGTFLVLLLVRFFPCLDACSSIPISNHALFLVRGDRFSLGGRASGMSTPLHPSAKRMEDEEDELTPAQSRSKRPKRDSSLNRSVGQQRLILKTKSEQTPDAPSPAPPGQGNAGFNRFVNEPAVPNTSSRRPRPLTQHQLAVEKNRRERVQYLLAKKKEATNIGFRTRREMEIPFARYGRLLQSLPDGYDTDDEEHSWGKGGLLSNPDEEEDYGECASYFLSVIRKATRRLDRWDLDDANGPKRDRKKEREERQKAKEEAAALENSLDVSGGRIPTSARSRARAARNAKRRAATAEARAAAKEAAATAVIQGESGEAVGDILASGLSPGGKRRRADFLRSIGRKVDSPKPGDGDADMDGLDDIDRELLGEGSGDEHEAQPERPAEPEYENSFVAEGVDDDGSSSDDADEEDLDENEGEADVGAGGEGNSFTLEGRNGYAASEASSAVGAPAPPATAGAGKEEKTEGV